MPDSFKGGKSLDLVKKDYHYFVRVLRYKKGYKFLGRDSNSNIYNLRIKDITEDLCILEVEKSIGDYPRLPEIILYQCVCKGKKMDQIIRQATEAGVSKIVPVVSDFSVSKIDTENNGKKDRWNKIIREAVQQSGSMVNTTIETPVTIDDISVAVDERQILSLFGREPHLIFSSSVNNWKVSFMSLYVWPYFPDILILVVT